jgi:hypothetical protein
MDADAATDERGVSVRRSRVVLMPRRWRQVRERSTPLANDGDNKPVHRGELEVSRKAVAWGRPVCSPLNLYARVQFCFVQSHARPRVQRAPGLPRALCFQEGNEMKNFGRLASREGGVMFSFVAQMSAATSGTTRTPPRISLRSSGLQVRAPSLRAKRSNPSRDVKKE